MAVPAPLTPSHPALLRWPGRAAWRLILCLGVLAGPGASFGQASTPDQAHAPAPSTAPVQWLRQAEALAGSGTQPPADWAGARPVNLPDEWAAGRAGAQGEVWYRLTLDGPAADPDPQTALQADSQFSTQAASQSAPQAAPEGPGRWG